jgi:sulfatase maturation enzyme AslB (radical SAM superfamily)
MNIPDNASFCAYPWFHQNIDSRGEVTLCCRSKTVLGEAKDLDTLWNGDEMRDIRQKMLDGVRIPHCSTCYHHERIGKVSNRQLVNTEWYPKDMWVPNLEDSLNNGLVVTKTPSRIDLKFGNLCNLACRMCSGKYSTQINKDVTALQKLDPATANEFGLVPVGGDFNWYEEPLFWEIVDRYIPHLLQLDITGGEPTLVEQNMVILNRCIELGYADRIKVSLNTNLTNLKPDFLAAITQFKMVTINASIDGMGLVQEYIRYPSKWSVIERNLITLFRMTKTHRMKINVSTVLQVYNVFQMEALTDHLLELFEQYGNPINGFKHQIAHVMWPTYLALENQPEPVRSAIVAMAQDWLNRRGATATPHVRNCYETMITQCMMKPSQPITAEDFLRYASFHDSNKKVDLEISIPRVFQLMNAA